MKQVNLNGKKVTLLSHKEKAQELGISERTLTRWKTAGKIEFITIAVSKVKTIVPTYKRPFYFRNENLVSGNSTSSENQI